ncbi:MAG: hypothetical protein H0W88_12415 [Parachlamydiaceae bacterium]|nr:hypothetical protein [Parachlamydiaceae bacterium]
MSAVPKKKLCWNCDGNVSKEIDNCPYCGVYLHADEPEETFWGPSYRQPSNKDAELEVPAPLYTATEKNTQIEDTEIEENEKPKDSITILTHLRQDIFPVLFLMSGSIFFLFGIILYLFSNQGTFTLQWNGDYWIYYVILSAPTLFFGWKYLNRIPE